MYSANLYTLMHSAHLYNLMYSAHTTIPGCTQFTHTSLPRFTQLALLYSEVLISHHFTQMDSDPTALLRCTQITMLLRCTQTTLLHPDVLRSHCFTQMYSTHIRPCSTRTVIERLLLAVLVSSLGCHNLSTGSTFT